MKATIELVLIAMFFVSCGTKNTDNVPNSIKKPLVGTWKLIRAITIEKGDTVSMDYDKSVSFIKIINDTHFAFLQHDLHNGKDATAVFASGGGSYSLSDSSYTEHLEYCSDRNWEGNDFKFTVTIKNDTLTQSGIEKIESVGVNRINTEKYIRIKK
jgi:hypothetical protein